jgi:hypothetical protein
MMKTMLLTLLMTGIICGGATTSDSALQQNNFGFQQPVAASLPPAHVPEPATMFLFGAGLIGLSAIIRRKSS